MKVASTCLAMAMMAACASAQAKGCLSGAAVGGVAGHVAGHHAVLGAVAGCAVNHHRNKVKDREAAAAAAQPIQSGPAVQRAQPVQPPR